MSCIASRSLGSILPCAAVVLGLNLAFGDTLSPWVLDPALSMPIPRVGAQGAVDPKGFVWIPGGCGGNCDEGTQTVLVFDSNQGTWSFGPPLPQPLTAAGVAVDFLGRIYVIGGSHNLAISRRVFRLDPDVGVWVEVSPLPQGRASVRAIQDVSGTSIYVVGGLDDIVGDRGTRTCFRYDVLTDSWSEEPEMRFPRHLHGVGIDDLGRVYAVGGFAGTGSPGPDVTGGTVERFDLATRTWTQVASLRSHPHQVGAVLSDDCGFIYAAGGWNPGYTDAVERYDHRTDTWEACAPLNRGKNNMASAFAGSGQLFVFGGDAGFVRIAEVEHALGCRPDAVLRLAQAETSSCEPAEVELTLDSTCPVQGLSAGIVHDGALVRPSGFVPAAVWGGARPEFFALNLGAASDAGDPDGERGVTLAMVGSPDDPSAASIPPGTGTVVGTLVYEPLPGAPTGTRAAIAFSDRLVPAVGSPRTVCRVVCGGLSVPLRKVDGSFTVTSQCFIRGLCNPQAGFDIADPIFLLVHLFNGGVVLTCRDACDANDDGELDQSDAVFAFWHLFLGGPAPPAPFPNCGADPSGDFLDCATFEECPSGA